MQEQFRNERISEATTRHQLDGIQRMFAKIIKGMMDEGIVIKDDPKLLAVELTAPAVLQIARSDRQPQCEKECMEYIEKHLRHFCKVYMRSEQRKIDQDRIIISRKLLTGFIGQLSKKTGCKKSIS